MRARYGTLVEVHEHWTLEDLEAAHAVLDTFETAEATAGDT